jgi:hypothetical protein
LILVPDLNPNSDYRELPPPPPSHYTLVAEKLIWTRVVFNPNPRAIAEALPIFDSINIAWRISNDQLMVNRSSEFERYITMSEVPYWATPAKNPACSVISPVRVP